MKKDFTTPLMMTLFLLICAYGTTSWGLFIVALTDYPVRAILIAVNLVFMAFASFVLIRIDRLDRKPRNIFLDLMDAVDEKKKKEKSDHEKEYASLEIYNRITINNKFEYETLMKYLEDKGRLMLNGRKPTDIPYSFYLEEPRASEVVITSDGIAFGFGTGIGCLSKHNQMYDSIRVVSLIEYFNEKGFEMAEVNTTSEPPAKKVVSEETRKKISEAAKIREAKKRENKGK